MKYWDVLIVSLLTGFTLWGCKKNNPDPVSQSGYYFTANIDGVAIDYRDRVDSRNAAALGSDYHLAYQIFEGGGVVNINTLQGGYFLIYKTYDSIPDIMIRGNEILEVGTRPYKTTNYFSDGAEVHYVDQDLVEWSSSNGNGNAQSTFEVVSNEFHQSGTVYFRTKVKFDCWIYAPGGADSLRITSGECFTPAVMP